MIKTLIFDLGGVLIHLNREESVRRFIKLGIHNANEMLDPYLQRGAFLGLEDGSLNTDEFEQLLSSQARRPITYNEVYDAWMGFLAKVSEDKLNYIKALKEKYRIVILSNTNPYIRAFTRSNQFTSQGNSLDYFVHEVYASYEMHCVKPSEQIFRLLITTEKLNPKEALFVDDGPRNIERAIKLGFHTLCPANGEDWQSALEAYLTTMDRN